MNPVSAETATVRNHHTRYQGLRGWMIQGGSSSRWDSLALTPMPRNCEGWGREGGARRAGREERLGSPLTGEGVLVQPGSSRAGSTGC